MISTFFQIRQTEFLLQFSFNVQYGNHATHTVTLLSVSMYVVHGNGIEIS